MKDLLLKVLDGNDSKSSKRLITLIIASHFIIASFVLLFLVCYVIMYLPKGKVDNTLISSLEKVLQYDFYIILAGLGFITSEGLVKIITTPPVPPTPPPTTEVTPLQTPGED